MNYERSEHLLARVLRASPRVLVDLLVVFAYVAVMDGVLVSGSLQGPLRVILGLPLLVFVPGYAVLAALFPRHHDGTEPGAFAGVSEGALTTPERLVLSFGVSLAVLPPLALAIELVVADFRPLTILGALNAFIVVGLAVAATRRFVAYGSEEAGPRRSGWLSRHVPTPSFDSRPDALLFGALVVVALVATSTLGVALVSPADGESFTNVALLTEDEDGNLTTSGYPANLTLGASEPLVVAVENHEDRTVDYTLVGELQRVDRANGSTSVTEESELVRQSRTVGDNETWMANVSVTPLLTGEDLRLSFMVYLGEAPGDPSEETAAEHVHLWVDVRR